MKKKYRFCLLLCMLMIGLHANVYAADSTVTTIPWDTAISKIVSSIQTVAKPVIAIMVAVTGMMVMFGTSEGPMKLALRFTLGIGLTLQVASLIIGDNSLFTDLKNILSGSVAKPAALNVSLTGSDKGINFIGNFMTYYENLCIYGASILVPKALGLLASLTIIDMTMTLMFKLEGDHIKYLLHQIIKVGFFIFLVQNWIGGTGELANIANSIFTSFEQYGILAAGGTAMKPENILTNAFQVISTVQGSILGSALKGNITMILFGNFIAMCVFICIVITSLQLVLTRLEFWTVAMIIVPLIPFGAYKHTRFLFEKAIGAVFNLGIKMGLVSFICIVSGPLISGMVNQLDSSWSLSAMGSNIVMLLQIFVGTLLLAVLSWKVPALASGLLTGQPSLGGSDMLEPIKSAASAANTASRAAGAVVQASNMAGGATALNTIAAAGGAKTGFAMRQVGTLRNLATMANQTYNPMSQGYNEGQEGVRNRMSRNKTNSEIQAMGRSTTKDENGNMSAGWKPTDSSNQQSEQIKDGLKNMQKDISSLKNAVVKNK